MFSSAKFELRWSSNNKNILNYILNNSESKDDKLILFHEKKELKTLGIAWDPKEDNLKYSINNIKDEQTITKRTVLSSISSIYDPL